MVPWDGTAWAVSPSFVPQSGFSNLLVSVSGSASDDAWAVGGYGNAPYPVGIRNSDHTVDLQVRKKRQNVPWPLMALSMSVGNGAISFLRVLLQLLG
jgi:hypothetical protein